jgi:toxin ParE1/3/4
VSRNVLLSSLAWQDFRDIGFYIARDNPSAADRLLALIDDKCRMLAANPELGERVPDLVQGQYRRFTVGSYVIYYLPTAEGITVARVLHGARDHTQLL